MDWYTKLDEQAAAYLPDLTYLKEEPMSRHTSSRIGGPARRLALPERGEQLVLLMSFAQEAGTTPLIVGNGTNLLVSDRGLDRLGIDTTGLRQMERSEGNVLTAEAGVPLARLADFACREGLAGLEFAHGIPGTLGGAVCMNAGAYGGEMKQVITSVTALFPEEGIRTLTAEELDRLDDLMASALEAGAGGNVIAGTVTLLSAMPVGVVQCTNPAAFSGGCDAESDEALRGRVLASYQRLPNGANAAYYEQEAMRYPGVAAAKAVGRARGIGTVNVVIATHAGVPDAALLAAVEMDLQKKREIAVDVKVLAPTVETVAVTAALKAAPGYTFAEVKAGAQSALEALFTGELLGKSVTTARLLTLLCGVEGVGNVHLPAPAADVAVGSTELPMLGTVTISELTEA